MPKKKIKICFLSHFAYSLFNKNCAVPHGGAELDLFLIASNIAKYDDFEVTFLVGDFGQKDTEKFGNITVSKYIRKTKSQHAIIKKISSYWNFFYALNKLRKVNADIYMEEAAGLITGIIAIHAKLAGKKFIYRCASDIDCNKEYIKKHPLDGFFYKLGLENANLVISQTVGQQEMLKKFHNIDSVLIKNSMACEAAAVDPLEKKYVLWVASSRKLKQPEAFLRLAKSLPEENFVMIMPKNEVDLWKKIEKECKEIPNLKFIERVPYEEIGPYFQNAKVFINTSIYEGFPNTFVQAAMSSTPIVSLNVNPDSFLTDWDCGYCCGGSEDKLAQFVTKLLQDKNDWETKSKNAFRYAKENHDLQMNIKKIRNIIIDTAKE